MSSSIAKRRKGWVPVALAFTLVAIGAPGAGGQAVPERPGSAKAKVSYKGKTSQGKRVTFKIKDGKVKRPSYLIVKHGCGLQFTFTITARLRGDRFSFGSKSSNYFKGKLVGGGRAKGRAGIDFSGSTCRGGGVKTVRWRAHRAG